jgi:UDP-glucose 4-epimerase
MDRIRNGEAMTIWGDGSSVRDYLFVDDFLALCLAILDTPQIPGVRTINAASGIGVSLNELLAEIESISGKTLRRTYETRRNVDAQRVVGDPALARSTYGWSAATSLQEGLQRTWNWLINTRC